MENSGLEKSRNTRRETIYIAVWLPDIIGKVRPSFIPWFCIPRYATCHTSVASRPTFNPSKSQPSGLPDYSFVLIFNLLTSFIRSLPLALTWMLSGRLREILTATLCRNSAAVLLPPSPHPATTALDRRAFRSCLEYSFSFGSNLQTFRRPLSIQTLSCCTHTLLTYC